MAGFLSLPTELIFEICDHLQPVHEVSSGSESSTDHRWGHQKSYRTLAALGLTCRHLRPIATQSLFKYQWAPYNRPNLDILRRLGNDPAIGKVIKHIRVLLDVQEPRKRSRREITADLERLPLLGAANDADEFLVLEPSGLEIAILVAQAQNLESLKMREIRVTPNNDLAFATSVPIWLLPIVEAGRMLNANPKAPDMYSRLRELRIEGYGWDGYLAYTRDLAYLFCLQQLRVLHIHGLECRPLSPGKAQLPWLATQPTSKLRDLTLYGVDVPAYIVVQMLSSCEALSNFSCDRVEDSRFAYHDYFSTTDQCRAWCVEVLRAVEKHSTSLKSLQFLPNDKHMLGHEHCFARVDSFGKLVALETLHVPLKLLVGKPSQTSIPDSTFTYPRIRDVLPPNLVQLRLDLCSWTFPVGTLDVIRGLLPDNDEENPSGNGVCRQIDVDFYMEEWDVQVPTELHSFLKTFARHGLEFNYTIVRIELLQHPTISMLVEIAKDLRTGRYGEEIISHFSEDVISHIENEARPAMEMLQRRQRTNDGLELHGEVNELE